MGEPNSLPADSGGVASGAAGGFCSSLIFQRLDRVHLRGAGGGDGAEDYADDHGGAEGDDHRPGSDGDGEVGKDARGDGQRESDDGSGYAAGEGDNDGFGEELQLDLAPRGPEGFTDTEFADAGAHAGQHDVHDADAADGQGDAGNGHQQQGERLSDVGGDFQIFL